MSFSANLGLLFAELPLLDAIRAAKDAGLDRRVPLPLRREPGAGGDALRRTGLAMLA